MHTWELERLELGHPQLNIPKTDVKERLTLLMREHCDSPLRWGRTISLQIARNANFQMGALGHTGTVMLDHTGCPHGHAHIMQSRPIVKNMIGRRLMRASTTKFSLLG